MTKGSPGSSIGLAPACRRLRRCSPNILRAAPSAIEAYYAGKDSFLTLHPLRLLVHQVEVALCRPGILLVAQRLDEARDHGKRRAQLVRDVRHELAPDLLQAAHVRDIAREEEASFAAVRDELQREVALRQTRHPHLDRTREVAFLGLRIGRVVALVAQT